MRHDDGRVEELRLHDYERLYSLPGVYEQIVQERLGCRSPQEIAVDAGARRSIGSAGIAPRSRVIDLAAGNGVSGEALAAEGLAGARHRHRRRRPRRRRCATARASTTHT